MLIQRAELMPLLQKTDFPVFCNKGFIHSYIFRICSIAGYIRPGKHLVPYPEFRDILSYLFYCSCGIQPESKWKVIIQHTFQIPLTYFPINSINGGSCYLNQNVIVFQMWL